MSFDIVAVCAANERQKYAFQRQIDELYTDLGRNVKVFADYPDGVKIGCGGAVFNVLDNLRSEFGIDALCKLRTLIIPAGGYSQRQPNAAALGKLFTVLPMHKEGVRVYTMLHYCIDTYSVFVPNMPPGVFVGAADILLHMGMTSPLSPHWSAGVTVLAHPSPLRVGRGHGVYVLDEQATCLDTVRLARADKVLQKPTETLMHENGAVKLRENGDEFVYTDSAYFVDETVVRKLLTVYDQMRPLSCEIDAYGDFLQPLGKNANDAFVEDNSRMANTIDSATANAAIQCRKLIFSELSGTDINALVLDNSRFYHIGSSLELTNTYCASPQFSADFNTSMEQTFFASTAVDGSKLCGSVIEFCRFDRSISVGRGSLISNCHTNVDVKFDRPMYVGTVPVRFAEPPEQLLYATLIFDIGDQLKQRGSPDTLQFMGTSVSKYWEETHWNNAKTFTDETVSLWTVDLFPVASTMSKAMEQAVAIYAGQFDKITQNGGKMYSAQTIMANCDIDEMIRWRKMCIFGDS